jgi:folate-binding protein YgfZ
VTVTPAGDALRQDYAALTAAAGTVELARDLIDCRGPEAAEYLQGQLSQDLDALGVGDSVLSLLLEPTGKLVALVRVSRLDQDAFLVDADAGAGQNVLVRLQRFKLRTRVSFSLLEGWRVLGLRGRDWSGVGLPETSGIVRAPTGWQALPGLDLMGPAELVPGFLPGARSCRAEAYEAVRIEAGWPVAGRELVEGVIPAEAGVVTAGVSFTKGCYTGQELVARIDSRGGNVPRRLRAVVAEAGGGTWTAGASVLVEGEEAGRLTSAAWSPRRGPVGLAYVHRRFPVPGPARIEGEPCRLEVLPLDAGPSWA